MNQLRRSRRGFSLMETLLVTAIAVVLFVVVYRMLSRGMELADSSARSIGLQQGARNLLENMVRDVNTCHMWSWAKPHEMTILKYQVDKPELVAAANLSRGILTYPFFTDGQQTQHILPVIKCGYSFNDTDGTVTRTVVRGDLVSKTPATGVVGENLLKIGDFDFINEATIPGEPPRGRVLAKNVKKFDMVYFGYDDDTDGVLKEYTSLTARNDQRKGAKIAMVAVHFLAVFDEGLYKNTLHSPEIDVMTKIWSMKKSEDHVYKEYFSSQDDDTRF